MTPRYSRRWKLLSWRLSSSRHDFFLIKLATLRTQIRNSLSLKSFLIATRPGTELALSLGSVNERKGGDHHENRNVIFSGPAFNRHARSERHRDGCGRDYLQASEYSRQLLSPEVSCDTRRNLSGRSSGSHRPKRWRHHRLLRTVRRRSAWQGSSPRAETRKPASLAA